MTVTRISPQEASEKLGEGWTYVDVRTTVEFEGGHPAGAVNVPLMLPGPEGMTPNTDFARVMTAAFPRDAKLVVGCKTGRRSFRAAQLLEAEGFTSVVDQRAGWDSARGSFGEMLEPGWSRVGLAAEKGQPETRSWEAMRQLANKP